MQKIFQTQEGIYHVSLCTRRRSCCICTCFLNVLLDRAVSTSNVTFLSFSFKTTKIHFMQHVPQNNTHASLPTTHVVRGQAMFSQVFVHSVVGGRVHPVLVLPRRGGRVHPVLAPGRGRRGEGGYHDQVTLSPPPPG